MVPATYVSTGKVLCEVPLRQLRQRNHAVHVRHDGVHWSNQGGRIVLYNGTLPPQVDPTRPHDAKQTVLGVVESIRGSPDSSYTVDSCG